MSAERTYHRWTNFLVIAVMIWNIAGWLGLGLTMNHTHTQDEEGTFCEISFCYCEVEEGKSVCTCHHNGLASHGEHHGDSSNAESCYFTSSHSNENTTSDALIALNKIQAACSEKSSPPNPPAKDSPYHSYPDYTLDGVYSDLLRPPRV